MLINDLIDAQGKTKYESWSQINKTNTLDLIVDGNNLKLSDTLILP